MVSYDKLLGKTLLHKHKTGDISDYPDTLDARYVEVSGDTMTGTLQVPDLQIKDENGGYDDVYHAGSFILNGLTENKQSLYVIVEGGEVYLETEAIGGGDLEYVFNESSSILDCTTGSGTNGRARVLLTQGTATSPQMNYVYVTDGSGTATINASTTFPTGTVGMICSIAIGDDVRTTSDGPAHLQRWTMSLKHDNGSNSSGDVPGTIYWMQRKLRALGAKYKSGITLTTDDTGGIIDLTAGGGVVYQLHPNTWESRQISVDGIYVANASGTGTLTVYQKLTDLASVAEFQDGTSIGNNKYFSVTVWGSMNSSDQNGNQSKLYFNLPTGQYLSIDNVISDANNYDVRTVPDEFSTTAFLICRLTMQRKSSGNIFVGNGVYSLLGQSLGSQGGGAGSSAATSFSDAQFDVFNDTDPTKIVNIDASSITTGTTRTITMADADVSLADIATNNTKVTNATHTGEVTGSGALTVADNVIDEANLKLDTAPTNDYVLTADNTTSGGMKWAAASGGGSNSFQVDQSGGTSDTYGVLSGAIDGSNTTFTVSQAEYISGSLKVYLNGQLQTQGTAEDWDETTPASGTFDFNTAPQSGDEITVSYQFVVSTSGNADTLDGEHGTAFARATEVADGWIDAGETWTYASADDPTYTFTISGDKTSKYSVGMKLKLTQTTDKYFIITAISYSSPNTTITVYGGTDYDLASATITSSYYSMVKSPYGFPMNPDKWTEITENAIDYVQTSPTIGVWYNQIGVTTPIGVWRVEVATSISARINPGTVVNVYSTLSTSSTTESNSRLTAVSALRSSNSWLIAVVTGLKTDVISFTSKTNMYVNIRTTETVDAISLFGSAIAPTVVRFTCAYL